jgi:hypothetical protein
VSLNVGGNRISGDVTGLDLSGMRELRLGNNSFTGSIPASAATAKWVDTRLREARAACVTSQP